MYLIDTHSHLYAPEFDADREEALSRAAAAGVGKLLLPAIDSESHRALFDLCRAHPDLCLPMMGLHPTSINDRPDWRDELQRVEAWLENPPEGVGKWCAVGEIGMDLYWSKAFRAEQEEAFRRQIDLSLRYGLPIAVHVRDAWPETLAVMRSYRGRGVRGIFHAFSDTVESARELRTLGDFCFGVGGTVTFKRSAVADVVRELPLDEIVLETDCPYLTPVPYRGQRNESAYVRLVCDKVAELKGISADEVAATTTRNACRLFGLPVPPQQ